MNADLILPGNDRPQYGRLQPRFLIAVVFALALMGITGCGGSQPASGAMPPPQVGVVTVQPRVLSLTNEFPGRVEPVEIAQVNARVDGVVLHRNFEQGAYVRSGQLLYQIDPAPYKAALESARATVVQNEAGKTQAEWLAKRYKPLMGINAVSRQNYDNAIAAAAQAVAGVAAARAAEKIAEINLGYCSVTAPIDGRIGPALVTEGALVSQSAATPMAVIQKMDPVYVDLTEPAAGALKLKQQIADGQWTAPDAGDATVALKLPDGSIYEHPGHLLFSDVSVNTNSGMITLRTEFANPEGLLLPGMFVEGRLVQAVSAQTILIPQPAVTINLDGTAAVMLVVSNQVKAQPVVLGDAVGGDWIIRGGLETGQQIMVDGFQRAQPGMTVVPIPAVSSAGSAQPAAQP